MSKIILTCQQWFSIKDRKPPSTICLFSDGVIFRVGWYDSDEPKRIKLPSATGAHTLLDINEVTHWTSFGNLVNTFKE